MKELLNALGLDALRRPGTNQKEPCTLPGTFSGKWEKDSSSKWITSISPIDNCEISRVSLTSEGEYEEVISSASRTYEKWRMLPAPARGEIIRQIGNEYRRHKEPLGKLVSSEMGKIHAEGLGEIQEVIDIADFAVGLSRQLYGKTMHSERPLHRMYEQWHPLGNVAVISAFNFPAAVWAWNSMIAAVCGNTTVWKPSELTPVTSIAMTKIASDVAAAHGFPALFTLVTGDGPSLGQKIAADKRFPLVSATGSCRMGRSVAETVGKRLGRSLLELGGNNALVVLKDADLDLAVRAILFGAVGTAGQRCTSTRRILVEKEIEKELSSRLVSAYKQVKIGNPLDAGVLMGPLINEQAVLAYTHAIKEVKKQGGKVIYGGKLVPGHGSPFYVEPTLVCATHEMSIVSEETFAPITYLIPIESIEQAIALNNSVSQGLSSAVFTNNLKAAEKFLTHSGSDCGIANVNIGTSGAEIGGAFGGEKDTGGGREAGSDAWKIYMRRQTCTINWGDELPLAQGISFG